MRIRDRDREKERGRSRRKRDLDWERPGLGRHFRPTAKPVVTIASTRRLVDDRAINRAVEAARGRVARLRAQELDELHGKHGARFCDEGPLT